MLYTWELEIKHLLSWNVAEWGTLCVLLIIFTSLFLFSFLELGNLLLTLSWQNISQTKSSLTIHYSLLFVFAFNIDQFSRSFLINIWMSNEWSQHLILFLCKILVLFLFRFDFLLFLFFSLRGFFLLFFRFSPKVRHSLEIRVNLEVSSILCFSFHYLYLFLGGWISVHSEISFKSFPLSCPYPFSCYVRFGLGILSKEPRSWNCSAKIWCAFSLHNLLYQKSSTYMKCAILL